MEQVNGILIVDEDLMKQSLRLSSMKEKCDYVFSSRDDGFTVIKDRTGRFNNLLFPSDDFALAFANLILSIPDTAETFTEVGMTLIVDFDADETLDERESWLKDFNVKN